MDTLPLAPLPRETSDESKGFRRADDEGFMDEQAVAEVIARGAYSVTGGPPSGMALSACGDDYAGWMLPVKSPFRKMADASGLSNPARLPQPPTLRTAAEPGIDLPYRGGHRWWLFGMSGAMTCGIVAFTLFALAQRHDIDGFAIAPIWNSTNGKAPAAIEEKADFPPSLTSLLPTER